MKLVLDIGNTAVKWATAEAGCLGERGRFSHRDGDLDRLAQQAWSGLPAPDRVVAVNVGGTQLATVLGSYAEQTWDCPIEFIQTSATAHGVTNGYRVPGDLGADRWVAMIAAHQLVTGPVGVIDCGTAVTVDLVTASGEHRGGLILPGINMLAETLQVNTAGIRLPKPAAITDLLGRGTRGGVTGGAQQLLAAAIDRIAAELQTTASEALTIIITGGDAERLLPLLVSQVQYEPLLVLQGLAIMADGGS